MAIPHLTYLDKYKRELFAPGYPDNVRTFYSPVDDVHRAILDLINSATKSLIIAMYGYDDDDFDKAIQKKLKDEHIYVQMSLDKSQAGGVHEKELLAKWNPDLTGNSIAIGHSEKGAIQHMKMLIIDGIDVVTGSTNWSTSGESKQDNQMTVIRDPNVAAEARSRIDIIHSNMQKQMAAK